MRRFKIGLPAPHTRRVAFLVVPICLLLYVSAYGGECSCKHENKRARLECKTDEGCWFLLFGSGPELNGLSHCIDSGRKQPSGSEALYTPVTGKFENVPLGAAVAVVTKNVQLSVQILGDKTRRISLEYTERPIQLVLLDLQRISGIPLETSWLPQFREGDVFSFCAHANASRVRMLLYAVTGIPVEIAREHSDRWVTLDLNSTTVRSAIQEFKRALEAKTPTAK